MKFDRSKPSTYNQRFQLWQRTGLEWEQEQNFDWANRGEASDLIGHIFEYIKKSTPPSRKKELATIIEGMVHGLTGHTEWTIDKLNTAYIPPKRNTKRRGGKRGGRKEPPRTEQEPEQEIPEIPEIPEQEPEQTEQEKAEQDEQDEQELPEIEPIPEPEPEPEQSMWDNFETPEWFVKPDNFDQLATMAREGIQMCFVGPAGCGKSVTGEIIAEAINYDVAILSFSGGVRYSQVFGGTKLSGGESFFEPGPLVKAACLTPIPEGKLGRLIILDEAFGCDPDIGLGLNSMTEPKSRVFHGPEGDLPVLDGVVFLITANGTGRSQSRQYTGVQRADDSMLSRFPVTVPFEYDSVVEELVLLKQGTDESKAAELCNAFTDLRTQVRQQNIAFDACTRRLQAAAKLVRMGIGNHEAIGLTVGNVLSFAERQKLGLA